MQAQHRWFRFGGRAGQATARWDAARTEPDGPEPDKVEAEADGLEAGVRGGAGRPGPAPGIGGSTRTAVPHAVQARSGQSAPCPSGQGGCSNSRSSPQAEQYKGDLPRL
nr:hypothetical protein GCM10010200_010670 [Actinomadura rugatobispora]